ncbi:hypothetical protein QBC33DRAFT_32006 [Phialemonium atrogriseum]|uniref:Mid2 domain-containing protein n=1 Tax=Phialemonium atrogriseum TaxID=1093897 RepID=A0AAJ0CAA8_9PEZI|nr:uncharacterized protein QBC33DRAFT_32006 [Phialemonium atrogriseum]KAK1772861.1 hypothetical protein QBC33DRAFT_32006 [Phialemonium atrogriseum]
MSALVTAGPLARADKAPALTTTFTPSSSCTVDIYQLPFEGLLCAVGTTSQEACVYYQLGPSTSSAACFPTGWAPSNQSYFSPGVCPAGYSTACSNIVSVGDLTETRATCCPTGYACQKGSQWPWYYTDPCTRDYPGTVEVIYTSSAPGHYVTATKSGAGVNAYGLEIRWQSTDFASSSPSSSPSSKSSPTESTTGPSSTGGPTAPAQESNGSGGGGGGGGLSAGAKAGIGIGAAIGAILVLVGVAFFVRRARTRRGPVGAAVPDDGKGYYAGHLPPGPAAPTELWTKQSHAELPGPQQYVSELPTERG